MTQPKQLTMKKLNSICRSMLKDPFFDVDWTATDSCVYTNPNLPESDPKKHCIVGHILIKAGIDISTICTDSLNGLGIGHIDMHILPITKEVRMALMVMQATQDRATTGTSWYHILRTHLKSHR